MEIEFGMVGYDAQVLPGAATARPAIPIRASKRSEHFFSRASLYFKARLGWALEFMRSMHYVQHDQ